MFLPLTRMWKKHGNIITVSIIYLIIRNAVWDIFHILEK